MCSVMCKMCIFRIKILYLSIHIIVVSSTAWKVSVFGVILVRFFPHFPAFGLNTNRYVFNPNAGKCGKYAEQNNSEYGQFLRSVQCQLWAYWPQYSAYQCNAFRTYLLGYIKFNKNYYTKTVDLVTFTEEIINGKLHYLSSVVNLFVYCDQFTLI